MSVILEEIDVENKIYSTDKLGFLDLCPMQTWTEFKDHHGYTMNNLVVIYKQQYIAAYRIREEGVPRNFEEQFSVDTENCEVSEILCLCTEDLNLCIKGKKLPITIYKGTVNVL